MSNTASDFRSQEPPVRPEVEGSSGSQGSRSSRQAAGVSNDSPTIITNRAPIPPQNVSDSVARILEGRVMPGDRLGHFDLVEYVGGGGMGRVFRAIDTQLGRTVALKLLPPEQAGDADTLQRFKNEAQSSARLDHDNIARVYHVGEDRGLHFIVFEFIEGVNVRVLVERKGPLPLAEAVSYTLQMAEALAHADARAVVHRDIKPSNILITPEGRVKLIDMGLARLRHVDPAVADLTASGVTLGTFDYISPEQARDPRNADIRSDIYSLGCTFFFMLAGQPPFPEGTVLQKLLQHQGDQPPDIREFRNDLPEESSRILRKMMAKDPRHRYASPGELVSDLLLLAEQIGLRPMSPTSRIWLVPQEAPSSALQRHLPWIAPIAALLLIVLLLDLFWSTSAKQDERLVPSAADSEAVTVRAPSTAPKSKKSRPLLDPLPEEPIAAVRSPKIVKTAPPAESHSATKSVEATAGSKATIPPGAPSVVTEPAVGFAPSRGGPSASGVASPESISRPRESAGAAPLAMQRSGVLIVKDDPNGGDQFSSLSAACAAAQNDDVIELRFDGPREDRPVKLSNLRITIRAGEKYQPVLLFRPTDADPVVYPRAMFSLAGGELTLQNVAVQLQIPRGVAADEWSMFETSGGQLLRLDRCSLTVMNSSDKLASYHQDAAFIRTRAPVGVDSSVGDIPSATPLAKIDLADCIVRGEAVFLRSEDLQPAHLTWDNGLLITSECLFDAGGNPSAPKLDEMVRIELRNLTAVVRNGLCRLACTPSKPNQLPVQINSVNCIYIGEAGSPLVEQEGPSGVSAFRQRFTWNGDRDFYQEINTFWSIRGLDPESPPEVMGFEAWRAYWGPSRESRPSIEPLWWKHSPNADRPLHDQGPADYSLEDPTFNDSSEGVPGFRLERLPPLPGNTLSHRFESNRGFGAYRNSNSDGDHL